MNNLKEYIQEKLIINKNIKPHIYTCHPKDKTELRKILKKRLEEDKNADLNDIDISQITNMHQLFDGLDPHNIDISKWDVSKVEDMYWMFFCCKNFNSDLSKWKVSKVENMHNMFFGCENFNSDLSNWDVSNVDDMNHMFDKCISLKNKPSWYRE